MPLKRICNKQGCNTLIDYDRKYCELHVSVARENEAERQKHYDEYRRDQKRKSFYDSSEWRKVRQIVLVRDNYLCADCLENNKKITPARMVHHVVELTEDWSLRLELSNLISLCEACHQKRHSEMNKK